MTQTNPSEIRILVVDDNPEVLAATVRVLAKAGYTVDQASRGEAAVASALKHRPNLLLLDRDMPGMDGMEVCRRIRTDPSLTGVFVIFVSGVNVASEEQAEGLESGADGYITRPIANRELLARVDAYVRILFLNRSLELHVEELKQAGEAALQLRLASLNLMEEAVTARDRAETVNRELQKEIAIRKAHEREIERLNRLYATLSQVNQAIVRTASREELLESICRIAIEYAGYKLAWIGRIDPQTQQVMPLASAGKAAAYVDENKVYADERPEGQGPGGICIREEQPSVFNNFLNASVGRPWHSAAQAHGLRSVASFPIYFQGRVWGVLSVYDGEVGVFQDREIALLVEATSDISFALDNLEREAQRQRAEVELQRHEQLLDETQQISKVGGWEYEVATGRITWTAEMFRIHGVADDYNPSPIKTEAIEFYAPADKQRVASAFQQALETGEPFELETELTTPQGDQKWARTKGQSERVDGKIVRVFGNVMDVTERKVVQERERLARETLELLNKSEGLQDTIPDVLAAVKKSTGIEAVAIRLREGEDFPYYVTQGFPEKFVLAERSLCARDPAGAIIYDAQGLPVLECMCGNILRGRTNPALPCFTEGGSFWSNGTTELLRTTTEADRQAHTRNRCNSEGYESVALIPLRAGSDIIGLLQFNDHRPNQFTLELIRFLEGLGASIGIALSRKRAEAALLASEASLVHAQQIARVGNWDWTIVTNELYWSAQVFALFGISEAEADRTYERFSHGVHPDDRERTHQAVQDALAGRAPYNIEHRVLWPDGTVRVMHELGEVTRDATGRAVQMTGTVHDITERKLAQAVQAQLATAVEQAVETIIITDIDGTITYANPAFEKTTGYTRAEVLGKNPRVLKSGRHDAAFYRQMWDAISRGEVWTGHFSNKRKDGTLFEEESTISPIRDAAGTVISFVAVKRDVTYEVNLESQLRQSQKMEAIGTMAGGIAHDFNNILAIIFGYSNLLEIELEQNPEALAMIGEIAKSGQRAKGLVQQILTFSRQRPQERQIIHLHPTLKEAMKLLRASLPSNFQIEMDLAADAPAVLADVTQIYQVVMNLGTNAMQAMEGMPTGRLTITLDAFQPDAACLNHQPMLRAIKYARLTVSDTGCGMTAKTVERIYDPFFTSKPVTKGTGLGLAVVHGIVKANDGVIAVESLPGQGTTFRVYFPEQVQGTFQDDSPEDLISFGQGQSILMVDDEAALIEMYQKLLKVLKYEGTFVTSPKEAVRLVRENPAQFDVIITDLTMPEMGGLEVARQIREIRADLPIILATGFHGTVTDQQLHNAGICEVVEKPISMTALAMVLHRWLGRKII